MVWTIAEKIGTMLFQMCVSFLILRILEPSDYEVVALLVVFTSLCSVIVDGGLTAAVLRKKEVSQKELTGVFCYNILSGVVLYFVLLALLGPLTKHYGNMAALAEIAPVLFLVVPITAFINIQTIVYSHRLDFKSITRYTLWGSFISSGVAVAMAYGGLGVWALVGQRLTMPAVRALLMWTRGGWKPSGGFTLRPLGKMFTYSAGVFTGDFLNTLYKGVPSLFIPRLYGENQLGYYDQAQKIKDMPVQAVTTSVQGVTLPSLTQLKDNPEKMRDAAHKIITVMNFIMFPIMIGLIAIAEDMFAVLLDGDKWMPSVPYFRIFCITGLLTPLCVVSFNIVKIMHSGKVIFLYEVIKKAIATTVLIATIPMGIKAIVWGQCAIFLADTIVNMYGAERFVKWGVRTRIKEFAPYIVISLIMWAAVWGVQELLGAANYLTLALSILTGVAVYVGLCAVVRPEAWRDAKDILSQMISGAK